MSRFRNRAPRRSPTARSIRRGKAPGGVFFLIFGLVFFLVGAGATWFISMDVWRKQLESRAWVETPAVILESSVTSSRSSDGTTYSPRISFSYEWEGRSYESDSWRFISVSSSNRRWAQDVVASYPPGSTHAAWVNPADPADAVLDPKLGLSVLLTFIPPLFLVVGLGIMLFAGKSLRGRNNMGQLVRSGDSLASEALRDGALLGLPEFPPETAGDVELKPRQGALVRFLTLAVFAAFWNGIVGVFLGFVIADGIGEGEWEILPILLLSVFVLIGLGLALAALYKLCGLLFGPRVRVAASSLTVRPEHPWQVHWEFLRGMNRVRELMITLEGSTEAEYTSGSGKNSSRVTDTKTFLRHEIFASDDRSKMSQGSAELELPANLPHSFEGRNNRVRYHLHFRVKVSLAPNVDEKYPLFLPPAVHKSSTAKTNE